MQDKTLIRSVSPTTCLAKSGGVLYHQGSTIGRSFHFSKLIRCYVQNVEQIKPYKKFCFKDPQSNLTSLQCSTILGQFLCFEILFMFDIAKIL